MSTCIGIDVGGPSKGFHAVAISEATITGKFASRSPDEVAQWCQEQSAAIIAVDAPCRWRSGASARLAERELAREKICCFSTPTEENARGHAFFEWMFAGHALFQALAPHFPICTDTAHRTSVAIETFPQAVACALAGELVSAKEKGAIRRELLERAGFHTRSFRNIDEIDAALCAIAASAFMTGTFRAYGDTLGGFIIVPNFQVSRDALRWRTPVTKRSRHDKFLQLGEQISSLEQIAQSRDHIIAQLQAENHSLVSTLAQIAGGSEPKAAQLARGCLAASQSNHRPT